VTFRFVHTADWQIGKTFASFAPEKRGVLQLARLEAIDRLADTARRAGARHVLVAGDALDAPDPSEAELARFVGRLAGDLHWHVLPGNHDPAGMHGVWARLARSGPPPSVHVHSVEGPVEISPGVWLLPAPVGIAAAPVDPTSGFDAAVTPAGALRIGLAHGPVRRFGGEADDEGVPIATDRARTAGLAYLALGDWHGTLEVAERTWYSGTPEPDRFVDNAAGNVLVVTLAGPAAPPVVEVVRTGRHAWLARQARLDTLQDLAPVEEEVEGLGVDAGRVLLRLGLAGNLSPESMVLLEHRLARLEARVFHFDCERAALAVAVAPGSLEGFPAGQVREAAARLAGLAGEADAAPARHAARALSLLAALSREAGGKP
jgi:hypothetical protein